MAMVKSGSASRAIRVMELIELGIESAKHRATLLPHEKMDGAICTIHLLLAATFSLQCAFFLSAEESHFRPLICARLGYSGITQQLARQRMISTPARRDRRC